MNIFKVEEGIWRGSAPETIADYEILRSNGIKYTLDLETGSSFILSDGNPLEEALLAEKYDIQVFRHPLGRFFPPTTKELAEALALITTHKPIFVHCLAGVDRTGMVIAYYRMIFQRWAKSQAVAEMKAMGMHWWYFYWIWSL